MGTTYEYHTDIPDKLKEMIEDIECRKDKVSSGKCGIDPESEYGLEVICDLTEAIKHLLKAQKFFNNANCK